MLAPFLSMRNEHSGRDWLPNLFIHNNNNNNNNIFLFTFSHLSNANLKLILQKTRETWTWHWWRWSMHVYIIFISLSEIDRESMLIPSWVSYMSEHHINSCKLSNFLVLVFFSFKRRREIKWSNHVKKIFKKNT